MIISDETTVMLALEPFFKGFIEPQEIADTSRSTEQVDELAGKALPAGGKALGEPDQGFTHMRGFCDLDGHQWSFHPHGHVRDSCGLTEEKGVSR